MKCIQYCRSTANRSLFVAPIYMLPSKPGVYVNCRPSSAKAELPATIISRSTTTVETGHEVNCTLDRVDDPSGDYNCQVFVDRGGNYRSVSCSLDRPPSNYGNYYCRPKTGANVNCRPKRNYQRQLSLGRRRSKQDTNASRSIHSTVYFVSKKTAFHIFARTRVSESNDALIYAKAYVL